MSDPLVSISCITYNHVNFIRDAIESFLMQKTDFPLEVLIHDDNSTDGAEDIIREYEKKYPDIIKPIYETENQWNKGIRGSLAFNFPRARGKYVALCEGDDYWTDPLKLQKQVDFLEKNPEYSMCFHPVRVFFEDKEEDDVILPAEKDPSKFTKEELIKKNFIFTNSVMYRKLNYDNMPKVIPGDWYMHLYHAKFGKIGFIDRVMSAYRRHSGGLWWDSYKNMDKIHLKHGVQEFNFHKKVYENFTDKSKEYFESKVLPFGRYLIDLFAAHGEYDKLEEFSALYPEYYDLILRRMQQKNHEIKGRNEEIQQTANKLHAARNSLRWRALNYLYKKYKKNIKPRVPKFLFSALEPLFRILNGYK